MPKINQEEYEVLKSIGSGWEWLARDTSGRLYKHSENPMKLPTSRDEVQTWLKMDGSRFLFIKSTDEPYNIAELIEEYEYSTEHVSHLVNERVRMLGKAWSESEEREVKKDKKWFVDKWTKERNKADVYDPMYHFINEFIKDVNQLDEPEVLSQEWIDEHTYHEDEYDFYYADPDELKNLLVPKQEITFEQAYDKIAESFQATAKEIESVLEKYYSSMLIEFSEEMHKSIMRAFDVEVTSKTIETLTGMTLEQIADEARNGGIVPKQELPVIPNYVAKWISVHHERFDLYPALKRLESNALSWEDVYEWYRRNTHTFVNAYLTGKYEVEEEQKYYVMNNDNRMMLVRMMDGKTITEADLFPFEELYDGEKKSHRLTEQEIKDYDERYFAFAEPVEEADFRLLF